MREKARDRETENIVNVTTHFKYSKNVFITGECRRVNGTSHGKSKLQTKSSQARKLMRCMYVHEYT